VYHRRRADKRSGENTGSRSPRLGGAKVRLLFE